MDGEGEAAAATAEGGRPAMAPPRQLLSRAALRRVAAVIVQLAGRAQYSKVRTRWDGSSFVSCWLLRAQTVAAPARLIGYIMQLMRPYQLRGAERRP